MKISSFPRYCCYFIARKLLVQSVAARRPAGHPVFFQIGASKKDHMLLGWVCLVVALFILIMGLVGVLQKVLLGASTDKATNSNNLIAIAIGCGGGAILVHSSSITLLGVLATFKSDNGGQDPVYNNLQKHLYNVACLWMRFD
jgi:hypothetical protein